MHLAQLLKQGSQKVSVVFQGFPGVFQEINSDRIWKSDKKVLRINAQILIFISHQLFFHAGIHIFYANFLFINANYTEHKYTRVRVYLAYSIFRAKSRLFWRIVIHLKGYKQAKISSILTFYRVVKCPQKARENPGMELIHWDIAGDHWNGEVARE